MAKESKYDHLLPQIIEDLKTMRPSAIERKHGIPTNCLNINLKRWRKKGLLPAAPTTPAAGPSKLLKRKKLKESVKMPAKAPEKIDPETRVKGFLNFGSHLIPDDVDGRSFAIGYRLACLDILGAR